MNRRKGTQSKNSKRSTESKIQLDNGQVIEFGSSLSRNAPNFTKSNYLKSAWGSKGLADLQFHGDRHYHPERLPSSRKDRPRSARLTNVFYQNLDFIYSISDTINTLDLTKTHLFNFPEELAEKLLNIETLILDDNHLSNDSFPTCFKDLTSLLNLSVKNNKLTQVPESWSTLFHLTDLHLEGNQIKSLRLLERFTKLKVLNIQSNHLESFTRDFFTLKKLEYLNFSENMLPYLPADMKRFINLKELNASRNKIAYVTPDIFLLPKVDGIDLSCNQILKIPTVNLKTKNNRKIHSVDISQNNLLRFPENVFFVTEVLDLSRNNIRLISNNIFKRLPWTTSCELYVNDNPISQPPKHICEAGLRAMLHYYHETQVDSKIYQGIKVYLLGESGCGKTSMIQSFLDQQSRPTGDDEKTIAVDIFDYYIDTSEDPSEIIPLNLSIWDFSGNPFYLNFLYSLMHLPSVTLLVFDLSVYSKESFHRQIGQFIDLLIMKNNRAVFLLIGAKGDLCKPKGKAEERLQDAQKHTEAYLNDYLESINHEIRCIEALDQISSSFNEQYRQLLQLKNFKVLFHPDVLATSSVTMAGIEELRKVLVELGTQTKTFPNVMRAIPALWGDVDNFLDDLSHSQNVLSFTECEELIHKKFGMKHLTKQICQYLHENGKAVYLERDSLMSKMVLLHPASFVDWIKCIFRDNLREYLQDPTDPNEIRERFLKHNANDILDYSIDVAANKGIFTNELMRVIWGTGRKRYMFVNYLCDILQWSYRVGNLRKGETQYDLNYDSEKQYSAKGESVTVKILCPAIVTQSEPEKSQGLWNQTVHKIAAGFRFSKAHPPMFFERLTVRLHEVLLIQYHWKDGLLCLSTEHEKVYIRVVKHIMEDGSYVVMFIGSFMSIRDRTVKLDVDGDSASTIVDEVQGLPDGDASEETLADVERKRCTTHIWKTLFLSILEAEKLVKEYPGAWYRRVMCCPECQELTFFGEWLAPKEAQSVPNKTCPICKNIIPIDLLIQPKVAPKRVSRPTTASQLSTHRFSDSEEDD